MATIHQPGWLVSLEVSSAQLQGDRALQQDCLLVRQDPQALIVLLADGVGGHAMGEHAAQLACFSAMRSLQWSLRRPMQDLTYAVRASVKAAHTAVSRLQPAALPGSPPASTLIAGLFTPRLAQFHVAYVGDSLLYRLHDGELELLFAPQTQNGMLVSAVGMLRQRAGGWLPGVQVKGPLDLLPGDSYLFASDGIGDLSHSLIKAYLGGPNVRVPCETLARRAMFKHTVYDVLGEPDKKPQQDNTSLAIVSIGAPPAGAQS